jgi:hypothetical protein
LIETNEILIDLSSAELESKMRLLTLAALGFKNIGQNLPYASIAEALQVDISEVEKWVIDSKYPPVSRRFSYNQPSSILQSSVLGYCGENSHRQHKASTSFVPPSEHLKKSNGKSSRNAFSPGSLAFKE